MQPSERDAKIDQMERAQREIAPLLQRLIARIEALEDQADINSERITSLLDHTPGAWARLR